MPSERAPEKMVVNRIILYILLGGLIPTVLITALPVRAVRGQGERVGQDVDPGARIVEILKENKGIELFKVSAKYLREDFKYPAIGFEPLIARYIVQDETKQVVGKLTLTVEPFIEGGKNLMRITKTYDFAPLLDVTLLVDAEDFTPLRSTLGSSSEASTGGRDAEEEFGRLSGKGDKSGEGGSDVRTSPREFSREAYYYYDMVTLKMVDQGAESVFSFRRLLPGYDIDAVPAMLFAFAVQELPARAVWYLTSPYEGRTYITLVERLGTRVVYGADAEKHTCEVIKLTSELFSEEYYVERTAPYQVVKFTAGEFTFTLSGQESLEPSIPIGGAG